MLKTYIYSIIYFCLFIAGLLSNDNYLWIIITLTSVVLFSVLEKLGKGIVIRELTALHLCVICLVMPKIGYTWYTQENFMARISFKYMRVPESEYFSFVLPAAAIFILALCWPLSINKPSDQGQYISKYLNRAKTVLGANRLIGPSLILGGVLASLASKFLPESLKYVTSLFYWASFTGFLYVFFSPGYKWKVPILFFFVAFIISDAISTGFFTIVAYMSITVLSFIFLGKKIKFAVKLIFLSLGMFLLILLQAVKGDYRDATWNDKFSGDRNEVFFDIAMEKITDRSKLFSEKNFFPIYLRGNQGFNISLVMTRFPELKPHDYGTNLSRTLLASIIPRLFWNDKPKAGGAYNMEYYTGIKIIGWSTNVGPIGEAYGSFGVDWGIFYMFILGFIIRLVYYMVFKYSFHLPLLLFWLPVIFYQVLYSSETDTYQILNSLMKSAIFIFILFKISPLLFGVIDQQQKRVNALNT